jgi:hypothetical protein
MRTIVLLFLSSALSFAGSWSGSLVDARCWSFEELNVGQGHTAPFVDRDRNVEAAICSPSGKTKSFAIVKSDGLSLNLDAAGNAKAAELVRTTGKKSVRNVAVTGEEVKNTIQVASISTAR